MNYISDFTGYHTVGNRATTRPLDMDTLRQRAPSIFATGKHERMSNRYAFYPTAEVVAEMERAGWLPSEVQQQTIRLESREGFQKHMIRFRRASEFGVPMDRGATFGEVVLINSHDGSSAYALYAGLFRFACANGLVVSDTTIANIKLRHSGFHPGMVVDSTRRLAEEMPRAIEQVEAFKARRLSPEESNALAVGATVLRWEDVQTAPVRPEMLLREHRTEDTGDDLWRTLNRVQENVIRGGQKDRAKRREDGRRFPATREVKGIDQGTALNRALWTMAELLRTGSLPTTQPA